MNEKLNRIKLAFDLKKWRETYGFTQRDVSVYVGCSDTYISYLEGGNTDYGHNHDYLLRIVNMMDKSITEYIVDIDQSPYADTWSD